ncbi:MAG: hypothetical protein AB8G05_05355 [Oligoflexales bacterium]
MHHDHINGQWLAKIIGLVCIFSCLGRTLAGPSDSSVSLGIINMEYTGLSIQKSSNLDLPSWHVSSFFQKGEFIQLNGDLQYFFVPSALQKGKFRGRFYSGIGMKVVSYAKRKDDEEYWLRIPLGTQFEMIPMRLQLFGEVTFFSGPIPESKLSLSPSLGMRVHL